jgi:hypothetical protein
MRSSTTTRTSSVVPTIGTLFLLSFVGAAIVGTVLISPVRRLGRLVGDAALVAAALGAIGIAVGTFVSLLISEYTRCSGSWSRVTGSQSS